MATKWWKLVFVASSEQHAKRKGLKTKFIVEPISFEPYECLMQWAQRTVPAGKLMILLEEEAISQGETTGNNTRF